MPSLFLLFFFFFAIAVLNALFDEVCTVFRKLKERRRGVPCAGLVLASLVFLKVIFFDLLDSRGLLLLSMYDE